jgi:hypothetical protein
MTLIIFYTKPGLHPLVQALSLRSIQVWCIKKDT